MENKIKENHSLYEAQRAEAHYYQAILDQKTCEIDYLYAIQKNFLLKNNLLKPEVPKDARAIMPEGSDTPGLEENVDQDFIEEPTEGQGYVVLKTGSKKRTKRLNADEIKSVHKNLNTITSDFTKIIDKYEKEQGEKNKFLENMGTTLKSMMAGGRYDKCCQVNELELNWGMQNISQVDIIEREYICKPEMNFVTSGFEFRGKPEELKNYKIEDNKDLLEYEIMKKEGAMYDEPEATPDEATAEGGDTSPRKKRTNGPAKSTEVEIGSLEGAVSPGPDGEQRPSDVVKRKHGAKVMPSKDKEFDSWRLPFGILIF